MLPALVFLPHCVRTAAVGGGSGGDLCSSAGVSWMVGSQEPYSPRDTHPTHSAHRTKGSQQEKEKKKQGGRACFGVINSVSSSLREDCRGRKESGVVLQQAGRLSSMLGAEPGDSPLCSSSAVLAGR